MTAVHHRGLVAIAVDMAGRTEHTITIEPLTPSLRAQANLNGSKHSVAIVERFAGDLIKICDTASSDNNARARAASYADGYGAALVLTAVQVARGDVLVDDHDDHHPVTSVYPVDQMSVTVHTDTGQHMHLTWSEAHTTHYVVVNTRGASQ